MAKEWARPFYHSKEWRRVRGYVLLRDKYKCVRCGDTGHLEVHHIIRLNPQNINDKRISLNVDNLITLCGDCHKKEHEKERNTKQGECGEDFFFDEDGNLQKKN